MSTETQRDTLAGEIADVRDDLTGIANILTNPALHNDTAPGWTRLADELAELTGTLAVTVRTMRRYANATHDPADVQIVQITDTMPATEEYGDYRGYVLEIDGQWDCNTGPTLIDAQAAAAARTGTQLTNWWKASTDSRGAPIWTYTTD
jgi:hypothetical protein